MSPEQRAEINRVTLGGERQLKAWLKVTDALQAFGQVTDALPGEDLVRWYEARSEACFKAQLIGRAALKDTQS